jgi:probable rRNA maturation factor
MTEQTGGRPPSVYVSDEQSEVPIDLDDVVTTAEAALALLQVPEASLTITMVDRARIAELKQEAFGVKRETDVLSFPMDDPWNPMPGPVVLGDIVVCPAVALRQARGLGIELDAEIRHLVVHGILHVLGRDHAEPQQELAMASEERRILSAVRA